MDTFIDALVATGKSDRIPEEYNWFGPLIGAWDFEWVDGCGTDQERRIKGEWLFAWILDGTAVQDIFICPSREQRHVEHQPDAEYGTTIRIYNPSRRLWEVFYGCTGEFTCLEAKCKDGRIVLTETRHRRMKWVFSDITADSFRWQRLESLNGKAWNVMGELLATRKKD